MATKASTLHIVKGRTRDDISRCFFPWTENASARKQNRKQKKPKRGAPRPERTSRTVCGTRDPSRWGAVQSSQRQGFEPGASGKSQALGHCADQQHTCPDRRRPFIYSQAQGTLPLCGQRHIHQNAVRWPTLRTRPTDYHPDRSRDESQERPSHLQ